MRVNMMAATITTVFLSVTNVNAQSIEVTASELDNYLRKMACDNPNTLIAADEFSYVSDGKESLKVFITPNGDDLLIEMDQNSPAQSCVIV